MTKKKAAKLDRAYYWVIGLTTILVLFGLIMITSASQIIAFSKYQDSLYFFKRQALYAITGAFLFWIFSRSNYSRFRQAALPLAAACILLLVMVFIPSIGHKAGGSSRWIPLGFINLQPSELAKLAAVLLTVYLLDKQKKRLDNPGSLLPFAIILVIAALVLAQPDMGTTVLIVSSLFALLFISGLSWRFVISLGLSGIISASGLILLAPYRFKRLLSFINPLEDPKGGGLQIIQSLVAMGSGGLAGTGLAMSKQKFFFLPAAHTDFIMAIIGEELGLLGTAGLVILFALLAIVGFSIAYNAKDSFGRLLATGITVMIILQAIVNMGAVAGLLPITGVPLPLISFGGSSLIVTMAALGILASIARKVRRECET